MENTSSGSRTRSSPCRKTSTSGPRRPDSGIRWALQPNSKPRERRVREVIHRIVDNHPLTRVKITRKLLVTTAEGKSMRKGRKTRSQQPNTDRAVKLSPRAAEGVPALALGPSEGQVVGCRSTFKDERKIPGCRWLTSHWMISGLLSIVRQSRFPSLWGNLEGTGHSRYIHYTGSNRGSGKLTKRGGAQARLMESTEPLRGCARWSHESDGPYHGFGGSPDVG